MLCDDCAKNLVVCGKCREPKEIVECVGMEWGLGMMFIDSLVGLGMFVLRKKFNVIVWRSNIGSIV